MNRQEKIKKIFNETEHIFAAAKNEKTYPAYLFLRSRVSEPQSFVTIIGESSSGKSTLMNSVFQKDILPVGVRPTTGTVTQLKTGRFEKPQYFAINRDATIESIPYDQFASLSKKPDNELLRLYAEMPFEKEEYMGTNIFDTPGFNSIFTEHEEILTEFIPQSDVVIFVVNYRAGFNHNDQLLMDTICDIRESDKDLPVLLAVNRCPEGTTSDDKRVEEIVQNASDSLHSQISSYYLISSVIPVEGQPKGYPQTDILWDDVVRHALDDKRLIAIESKIIELLSALMEEMYLECENQLTATRVDKSEIQMLEENRKNFKKYREKSHGIVDKYINRLDRNLPGIINHQNKQLIKSLLKEINEADKWTESYECSAFITAHAIPFGVRRTVGKVEDYIRQTFEQMDQELSEMANKAIHHVDNTANQTKSPEFSKLVKNLAKRLGCQLFKSGASSILKGLGGVGGIAAGTGNLVKMIVSRTGKLFGKTFSREVYTQIGKIFTKKMMQRLNVAITIISEVWSFVSETTGWKKALCRDVQKCIENWEKDVLSELTSVMLPQYSSSNKNLLDQIYDDFDKEIEKDIHAIKNKINACEGLKITENMNHLRVYKQKLKKLQENI